MKVIEIKKSIIYNVNYKWRRITTAVSVEFLSGNRNMMSFTDLNVIFTKIIGPVIRPKLRYNNKIFFKS